MRQFFVAICYSFLGVEEKGKTACHSLQTCERSDELTVGLDWYVDGISRCKIHNVVVKRESGAWKAGAKSDCLELAKDQGFHKGEETG